MMFSKHVSEQLAAHIDGRSSPDVARHLQSCERCQAECDQVREGIAMMGHLSLVEAPDAIWKSIEAALPRERPTSRPGWSLLAIASAAAVFAYASYWILKPPTWEVTRFENSTMRTSRVSRGESIETDAHSHASIKVGSIGFLNLKPETRVQVLATRPGEHRVTLVHGEIHASISAPPRLFFVNTASATAVDLGCEYDLKTNDDGSGLLSVTRGWVALEWNGRESLVPAGASCRTHAQTGPGIPYFDDASDALRHALEQEILDTILQESRARDTLSLWHLLFRVDENDRARVFDRMAALTPLPPGVSREQALKLDPEILKHWREELAWTW